MKPFNFETSQKAKGRARVAIVDAKSGKTVWESEWQRNLILDSGLDYVAANHWSTLLTYSTAGTSNTPTKDLCDGTYSQTGTTVTRTTGTRDFISGDVGKLIRFADGTERKITAFTDATTVTVATAGAVTAQAILIYRVNQIHLGAYKATGTSYPEFLWEDGEKSQYTFWDFATATTTFRRTYDYPEEVGSVNYTELGFSPIPPRSGNASSTGSAFSFFISGGHGLVVGQTIKITGYTPSAYNGTWVVATTPTFETFTISSVLNPGNSSVNGLIHNNLFSRILLAGAVSPGAGQLLRVKYELSVKLTGGLASEVTTVDGGITGWPLPYNIASITSNGTAWTITTTATHHFVAGGKINIDGALRPKVAITAATSGGANFTITAAGHGRSPGDSITIEGMTPSGYNGTFTVASVSGDDITVTSLLNPGTGTVFGTVRQATPGTWYTGEKTIASVTGTTIVITDATTIPAAGASGTVYNNTKRKFRMFAGMGMQQLATTGYANNPLSGMTQLAAGAAAQTGPGFLESSAPVSGATGTQIWLGLQAVGITVPPAGFPRSWSGTGAGSPGALSNEAGLSNVVALDGLSASDRAGAGPDAYTLGTFRRNTKITFGAGAGNRNDLRMITIHTGPLFNGALNTTFHGISGYILFEERQKKEATHKLEFNIARVWNRDLSIEAS